MNIRQAAEALLPKCGVVAIWLLHRTVSYNWDDPRVDTFDRSRYEAAMEQAAALPPFLSSVVRELHLMAIPDATIHWATGQIPEIPRAHTWRTTVSSACSVATAAPTLTMRDIP
jgi:hypothetical protein